MEDRYPLEILDDDDGTMIVNVATLADAVVGRRIVAVNEDAPLFGDATEIRWQTTGLELVLDDGRRVVLVDDSDCCAFTALNSVIRHLDQIDHIIAGVGTTEGYTRWHIYADLGDVLELGVSWSAGNPFYYGYGFDIHVIEPN